MLLGPPPGDARPSAPYASISLSSAFGSPLRPSSVPTAIRSNRSSTTRRHPRSPAKRSRPSKGRRRFNRRAVAVIGLASAIAATLAYSQLYRGATSAAASCTVAGPSGSQPFRISPEQAQNASIIAAVALKKGLPDHAVTVALATSLQESKLRNLAYGDLDSVGLFQQRPSQGWGPRSQLLDPIYAASAFFNRLVQVNGWSSLTVTEAAQSVQLSAAPTAYAAWEPEARALAIALTGEQPAALSCRLPGFAGPKPATSALAAASTNEMGSPMLGVPLNLKVGWQVASWAVAHAWQYHLQTVRFGNWTWSASAGVWVPGAPSGTATTGNPVLVTYAS